MSANWKNKRVLVTGAGGFIGSHLAEELVRQNARVRALVHYRSNGSWGWLDSSELKKSMEVVAGDIRDSDWMQNAMKGVDVVFHLAALIGIPYSYEAPESYVATNVNGTLNVLQAARRLGTERVVHTSTSEVYGTARYVPIDETHPLQGQSPYAATKIAADKLVESFHLSFGLPVVTIRPFNTFGPRQSSRAIIPTIITQCLSGSRIELGNLRPTRDLNFVQNTVEGFLQAASSKKAIGQTINLGSGRDISIGELAQLIAKLMGGKFDVRVSKERLRPKGSEVERLLADNRHAKKIIDWRPRVSLEEGLKKSIPWFERNARLYRSDAYVV